MSLPMQLNIFSGRPNPRSILPEAEALILFKRAVMFGPAYPMASRGLGFTLLPVEPHSKLDHLRVEALCECNAHGLTLAGASEMEEALIAVALKHLDLSTAAPPTCERGAYTRFCTDMVSHADVVIK